MMHLLPSNKVSSTTPQASQLRSLLPKQKKLDSMHLLQSNKVSSTTPQAPQPRSPLPKQKKLDSMVLQLPPLTLQQPHPLRQHALLLISFKKNFLSTQLKTRKTCLNGTTKQELILNLLLLILKLC
jgi:hypothetical protein